MGPKSKRMTMRRSKFCHDINQRQPFRLLVLVHVAVLLVATVTSNHIKGTNSSKFICFFPRWIKLFTTPLYCKLYDKLFKTHIALWSSDLNIKQAKSRQYVWAHQDATYTGLVPANECLTGTSMGSSLWPSGYPVGVLVFSKRVSQRRAASACRRAGNYNNNHQWCEHHY